MSRPLIVAVALLVGCKVVDAPENVEDLVVYGFEHFDDDPEFLAATAEELFPWVADHFDEMNEGWRVNNLSEETVASAGVEDPDLQDVVGAIASVDYRHRLSEVLPVILAPNKDELFENHLEYDVLEETDLPCFLAKDCETYRWTVRQVVQVPVLGTATQTFTQDLRWIEGTDGKDFVVIRSLTPEPIDFSSSFLAVDQQYALVFLYPHRGHARRAETYWVESRVIGLDVPDSFAVSQAAGEMGNQADRIDDYIDAQ